MRIFPLEKELFGSKYELLPTVNQKYELELALAEVRTLSDEELIRRSAYLKSVDGIQTFHYKICEATPNQVSPDASEERKRFFEKEKFSVGYATHGLFPYRGKFHPQMIKAIMNIIGIQEGDTVLDPMVGSGTTVIEALLIGANAVGVELNPFTAFMSKTKVEALEMEILDVTQILAYSDMIFDFFNDREMGGRKTLSTSQLSFELKSLKDEQISGLLEDEKVRNLFLLCYLDALGYARRRKTKTPKDLFPGLLKRYLEAVNAFNKTRERIGLKLGKGVIIVGDARKLPLEDETIEGIIFSPPYSFAIDYVENDRVQLEYMGINIEALKTKMIGLRGESIKTKLKNYFEDMGTVLAECYRVLKPSKYCVIIIGSNTVQTGGVRLEKGLIEISTEIGFSVKYHMIREIEGIRNVMREEHIIFLQKV